MEIKTKFSIGSQIWTINDCKATKATIYQITIDKDGTNYDAKTPKGDKLYSLEEKYCFPSKEALLSYVASE